MFPSRPAACCLCLSIRGPTFEEGTILLFLPHVRQQFGPGNTLPVVLFLSTPPERNSICLVLFFLLVYRILMILIIAIIINIIMIAIVTVNVVITGIIMKTCLFFFLLLPFFIYVIMNDVTVFGFCTFFESVRLASDACFFYFFFFFKFHFLLPFFGNAFVSVSDLFFLSNKLPVVLGGGAVTSRARRLTFLPLKSFPLVFPPWPRVN